MICPSGLECQNPQCLLTGECCGNWIAAQASYNHPLAGVGSWLGALGAQQAQVLAQHPFAPKEPLERASITVGEITGWRIWGLRWGYLMSFTHGDVWVPDEPMVGDPDDYGAAGVWAFKDRNLALRKMLESGPGYAYGTVSLWGEVVEHDLGYRAQFARVASIEDIIIPVQSTVAWLIHRRVKANELTQLRKRYITDYGSQPRLSRQEGLSYDGQK